MHYDSASFFNRENISGLEQLRLMLELQRGIKEFVRETYGESSAQNYSLAENWLCEKFNDQLEEKILGLKFPM